MRNALFSSLLAALVACTSLTASATTASMSDPEPIMASMTEMQAPDARININSADALTLQKELSGIGLNKANAIVAYREANGNFTSVDELLEVKGIGKTLLDKNRDRLAIE
ncbi:helix-hairpin-helix domain-containing protein [Pseudomonas sp. DTU_2021_1001937_2_SI_NGA_ILE_001]|uniref:ComEA family DNA-binding protein n=1 Tax=Pseudomonas sp. DTU_2021_1001937_2_SI_NGA_ILE_001 TaxID=3077589 RepID=UPI0025D0874D|nr:helix-hairpin-helix domain-containing protein [Pseudomonas sp. DTU_2021_1001937_2_SI_NGA_ILE_001]WNW13821.1 helix-hairpin-helix domain-containing protein [Pseudomonas sp. DTU_2021_1001937_2_SI_NGA_ILE_001]